MSLHKRIPQKSPGWHFYSGTWWRHLENGYRRRGIAIVCGHCGKRFVTYHHERLSKYCSSRCANAKHRKKPGATRVSKEGYVVESIAPDDPMAVMRYHHAWQVPQHRLRMARALGRPLHKHESVHHLNGDPLDNRLENLQLRSGPHGYGQIARCADCGSQHIVFEAIA